jgi:4-aminobutyrate aminotransferase
MLRAQEQPMPLQQAPSRDTFTSKATDVIARCSAREGGGLRTLVEGDAVVLDSGEGAWLEDIEGKRYLDFSSLYSVAVTGHCHPAVVRAVQDQSSRLMHSPSSYPTRVRAEFAEAVASIVPDELDAVLPAVTGAMANEVAIQIARTRRPSGQIISFSGGYFGRTPGTVALAGKAHYRQALGVSAGAQFFPYPYPLRMGPTAGDQVLRLLDLMSERGGGLGEIAAVVVEPILGNGGVVIPPSDFLPGLRSFCDRTGALLIVDEIQSGCGRCGTMWATELTGTVPDLMTIGKGIGGGMAVAAVVGRREYMAWPSDTFTSTFLTNNVNMAAAIAAISVIKDSRLSTTAATLGAEVHTRLTQALHGVPGVAELRSVGLWHAIELQTSDGAPNPTLAKTIARDLRERGVIVGIGGYSDNVIKLQPPLVIDRNDLNEGLEHVISVIKMTSSAIRP